MIAIVIGDCTVLLLLKYGITVYGVLFDFWSYFLIFYIHLHCINTHRWITTLFSSWLPSSQLSVLCCTTKIRFFVCVVSFGFYSTCYKVYIYLPCINTHWRTTASFDLTHVLSSSNFLTTRLYQVSSNHCGGNCNSDVIHLLQPYLTIHYCHQSVLSIVPDLNIVDWSITFLSHFKKCPSTLLLY